MYIDFGERADFRNFKNITIKLLYNKPFVQEQLKERRKRKERNCLQIPSVTGQLPVVL